MNPINQKYCIDLIAIFFESLLDNSNVKIENRQRRFFRNKLNDFVYSLTLKLKPKCIFEIGANEASFSSSIKNDLEINAFAFEANPLVFARNSQRLIADGVIYLNKCISNNNGFKEFHVPLDDSGDEKDTMGSILKDSKSKSFNNYLIQSVTLDDFVQQAAIDYSQSCIWIDVEGAADEIISGGSAVLSQASLVFIELEKIKRWEGQSLDVDIIKILSAHGLVPVFRDIQRPWQYNCLFVREDIFFNISNDCIIFLKDLTNEYIFTYYSSK